MSGSGHPRLATWILTRCAPEYRRDSFIGDLIEQYAARGSWWYWRQALGAARTCAVRRLLTANDSNLSAAEYVGDLVTAITLALFALNQLPFFADLLSSTPLFHSRSASTVAGTLLSVSLLGAVTVAHVVRTRTAAAARQAD